MQFPSTWCPLTGAPSFQVWAAALLQHQNYDGLEGGVAAPCLNLVIDLSGHLHWLFIICSLPTSQQGGMCLDTKP